MVSMARGSEWAHPTREKVLDIRSRSCEDGGRLAPQFKTFQKPLQENPTHVRRRLPEPIVIPEPPFAFVGLMGVARAIARAIAATAEGGPLRLRVNPALHTELSGVGSRGDKTHLLVKRFPKREPRKFSVSPNQFEIDHATRGATARGADVLAMYEPCMSHV